MPTDYAIDIEHVAKTYKNLFRAGVPALRGIEMKVHRGEIFGLLGPNGAGKSTLVKILMTVIRASQCKGTMLGAPIGNKATLSRVGYLPEHHTFPPYLTSIQLIEFFGAMTNVSRRDRKRRSQELLELVGMGDWGNKKIGSYSKGMRQRVGIAQTLINDPDLILLDEPTDGVDPVGRRDIRHILERLGEQGKTIFINSHLLSELEQVSHRVAIIVQGLVARQGTIDDLTNDETHYEIQLSASPDQIMAAMAQLDTGKLPSGRAFELKDSTLHIATDDAEQIQPIIDRLRAQHIVIQSIRMARPTLEDLFMQAVVDPSTGQALKPGAAKQKKRGA